MFYMEKQTLSDKIIIPYHCHDSRIIHVDDVKEFIKELKLLKDNREKFYDMNDKKHYIVIAIEDIDKLAGERLI